MKKPICPKCKSENFTKSGVIAERQRYLCRDCKYNYTVNKEGKNTDPYYVIKGLQLHLEGVSLREIERIIGVSHVTVSNWVKKYLHNTPKSTEYRPTYEVMNHKELVDFISEKHKLKRSGCIITELGDKFMIIKWEKFRKSDF
jgi:transposase-like protein